VFIIVRRAEKESLHQVFFPMKAFFLLDFSNLTQRLKDNAVRSNASEPHLFDALEQDI